MSQGCARGRERCTVAEDIGSGVEDLAVPFARDDRGVGYVERYHGLLYGDVEHDLDRFSCEKWFS